MLDAPITLKALLKLYSFWGLLGFTTVDVGAIKLWPQKWGREEKKKKKPITDKFSVACTCKGQMEMVRALDRTGWRKSESTQWKQSRASGGGKVKACSCQNVKPRKRPREQRGRNQNNICKLFHNSFWERERSPIVPVKCAEKIIHYTFTITGKISMRHV